MVGNTADEKGKNGVTSQAELSGKLESLKLISQFIKDFKKENMKILLHFTCYSIKEFSTLCLVLKYKEESIAKHKFDDL